MASIYYAVKLVALLWILMLIAVVLFGANKSKKDDRNSQYGMAYRIYVEEKALTRYFGEAYNNYSRKTSRLIPGIF